jgi:hypothetical protein
VKNAFAMRGNRITPRRKRTKTRQGNHFPSVFSCLHFSLVAHAATIDDRASLRKLIVVNGSGI